MYQTCNPTKSVKITLIIQAIVFRMVHGISSDFIFHHAVQVYFVQALLWFYIYPISHIKINISSVSNRCTSDCSEHCKLPTCVWHNSNIWGSGGHFKNAYELLTLRALKISMFHKRFIFQCMGKIFCMEFQRYPLKFHTKYLTHTLKDMTFIQHWNFKSS